jgi:hypothetical protein
MQNLRVSILSNTEKCEQCRALFNHHFMYFGKRVRVTSICPSCQYERKFSKLNNIDRFFLRIGFFTNPFYLPHPDWYIFLFFFMLPLWYGMFLMTNLFVNLIYFPIGVFYNNIKIFKSTK